MSDILNQFPTPYVDAQTLLLCLQDYVKPRDWIARQVKAGKLIRLKNGFYLIASRFNAPSYHSQKIDFPFEQLANLLYGPSYISLEWALSFYQFIPERVTVVTSMTLAKTKKLVTPIGEFSYRHIDTNRFAIGIVRKEIKGQFGAFLIATPEKALADWVFLTCKGLTQAGLLSDLLESKRIEEEKLRSLNLESMKKIAEVYNSDIVYKLYQILRKL